MDIAYNQHSSHSRRGRSSTNLNHLTLAPLTSRFPIPDHEVVPESHHVSYIEGRSAPTTPSILSRSSSRVSMRKPKDTLPKSKSSTQLKINSQLRPGTVTAPTTPGGSRGWKGVSKEDLQFSHFSTKDGNNSDWLLRAGASISSSARESKGQTWLVSRASSTSVTGEQEDEQEELHRELARVREQRSRRGSVAVFDADDEFSPIATRRSLSFGQASGSRPGSQHGSRVHSRKGSKVQLFTPMGDEGYFDRRASAEAEFLTEPDFVDAEEEDYENDDQEKEDEAAIQKLARTSSLGLGAWMEKMLGWSLFGVDDNDEEDDIETTGETLFSPTASKHLRSSSGVIHSLNETPIPPPKDAEAGTWQDAAWLLSVASKVIL